MKKIKSDKCWICGSEGTSGEHLLKASDIKLYFPDITQTKPAYYHDRYQKNVPLGSRHSKRLHSKAMLCKKCNNQRTQPYDMAWKNLSNYLYQNSELINKTKQVDLTKVFDNDFQNQSNNIQLFFVKLLGCLFWDIPDKRQICKFFSESILNGCSREDVFLKFNFNEDGDMGVTDLFIDQEYIKSTNLEIAAWMYYLPHIKIKIYYSSIKSDKIGWLPTHSKIIKLD